MTTATANAGAYTSFDHESENLEPAPREVSLAYLDQILANVSGIDLAQLKTSSNPNRCDLETREAHLVCDQCDRRCFRIFGIGRYLVCRTCAASRLKAAEQLNREAKSPFPIRKAA